MLLQDRQGDKQVKLRREVVGPQQLPQPQDITPVELALVPDEQHAEEEEEVGRVGGLEVQVELWVEELDELVERGELGAHAGLVAHEVARHAVHGAGEGPEGDRVVLEHGVDGREEVGHALHVAEVLGVWVAGVGVGGGRGGVVFEVGEEHVFELFEVHVCAVSAGDVEGGGGVGMRDVFAGEEGDVAVGSVDVFFYGADSEVSGSSDAVCPVKRG